jgi:hypothetical protein
MKFEFDGDEDTFLGLCNRIAGASDRVTVTRLTALEEVARIKSACLDLGAIDENSAPLSLARLKRYLAFLKVPREWKE